MNNSNSLQDEISKLIDDRISNVLTVELPSHLYHYTDASGLKGILESKSLWFSDIFNMNDPSELQYGIEVSRRQIEEVFHEELQEHSCEFSSVLFEAIQDRIKETANYFIFSLSKDGDDLGQWRAYAADGHGFALGFNKKIDSIFCKQDESHQSFYISYDEEALKKSHRELADIIFRFCKEKRSLKLDDDEWVNYMIAALILSMCHKHSGYKNEEEYRFLQLFKNGEPVPNLKHRLKKNKKGESNLVGYREFDWGSKVPCLLEEIVVGPSNDFKQAKEFVTACLKAYGYDSSVIIRHSDIPYRS
ncbi:MAG: DUF2971 domain-containing protein [Alphaproteobacteria bacterium]|nr:DUF2971 domain-containing protein [Alphaproteobacteria bacterium]